MRAAGDGDIARAQDHKDGFGEQKSLTADLDRKKAEQGAIKEGIAGVGDGMSGGGGVDVGGVLGGRGGSGFVGAVGGGNEDGAAGAQGDHSHV